MKRLKLFSDGPDGEILDLHMTWDNGKVEIIYCEPLLLQDVERWIKVGIRGIERRPDFTCETYYASSSEPEFFDVIARSMKSQFGDRAEITDEKY